jgi:hypothetical protein
LELICSKCGEPAALDEVIEAALKEDLSAENYFAAMEGDNPALEECPECSRETYVSAEGKCLNPDCEFRA